MDVFDAAMQGHEARSANEVYEYVFKRITKSAVYKRLLEESLSEKQKVDLLGQLDQELADLCDSVPFSTGNNDASTTPHARALAGKEEQEITGAKPSKQLLEQKQDWLSKKERKFGASPPLGVVRSHARGLDGERYCNKRGKLYYGSICGYCEEQGKSCYHHPLRCHVKHTGWRQRAPELHGCRSWYVRGGSSEELGDQHSVCQLMRCGGE